MYFQLWFQWFRLKSLFLFLDFEQKIFQTSRAKGHESDDEHLGRFHRFEVAQLHEIYPLKIDAWKMNLPELSNGPFSADILIFRGGRQTLTKMLHVFGCLPRICIFNTPLTQFSLQWKSVKNWCKKKLFNAGWLKILEVSLSRPFLGVKDPSFLLGILVT